MATVYTKTDNYGLNLYGDNDPADLRDGYNNSMHTIDTTLKTHLNRIEGVEARETHDEAVMKTLLVDNTVDNATAAKTKWDKASTDAAAATGKANANKTILDALGADTTDHATANKTKWDKAGTDATEAMADAAAAIGKADANKMILNALGADTTGHATILAQKWNGYDSRFDSYIPKRDWSKPVAVFGDSIAYGTGTTTPDTDAWPKRFAAMIGASDVRRYATNNAGFTVGGTDGKTVIQQIQSVPSNRRSDVGTVIISAGINDFDANLSTLTTAMRTAIAEAVSVFPNAVIIVVAGLCGNNPRISHPTARTIMQASGSLSQGYAHDRKIWVVPYSWEINAFQSTYYATDNIHLTTAGALHTAKAVFDYVFHGIITRANYEPHLITLGPGITVKQNDMKIACVNGIVSISGQLVLSVKATAFTRFINMPYGFEYERIIPAMIATNGAHLFYNQGYGNTIDTFSDIPADAAVYANAQWTYGL